jgi:hypothetical protein
MAGALHYRVFYRTRDAPHLPRVRQLLTNRHNAHLPLLQLVRPKCPEAWQGTYADWDRNQIFKTAHYPIWVLA